MGLVSIGVVDDYRDIDVGDRSPIESRPNAIARTGLLNSGSQNTGRCTHRPRVLLVVAVGLFKQLAEVLVLAPRRFEIERLVLDADPEVVQQFL